MIFLRLVGTHSSKEILLRVGKAFSFGGRATYSSRVHARIVTKDVGRLRTSRLNIRRSMATSKKQDVSEEENAQEDALVKDFLNFLNKSHTAFHAVHEVKSRLLGSGYKELNERETWNLVRGGRYFFTRNVTTIVAFAVGAKYRTGSGTIMIGAHTDSPCLKLKPISGVSKCGFDQIGVQCYGGGLWTTWFDRDLTVAGRVIVNRNGAPSHELVRIKKPICRIPSLAIHLARKSGTDFVINKEDHLDPVLNSVLLPQLVGTPDSSSDEESKSKKRKIGPLDPPQVSGASIKAQHHPALMRLIADELKCDVSSIIDIELQLCDFQDAAVGGAYDEFIYSGRLDNLASVYTSMRALIDTTKSVESLADESCIRAVTFFDHEEVGSRSAQGAGGPVVMDTIERLAKCLSTKNEEGAVQRMLQSSFLISADMAHGLHPNYSSKHQKQHAPMLQEGVTIKHNCNQRYATNVLGCILFRQFAALAKCPVQEFVVRNDCGCGSTIGPIVAGNTGMRTVDVGGPQWSMHSIREVMGTKDVSHCYLTFRSAFLNFSHLSPKLVVDCCRPCGDDKKFS